MRTGGVIYFFLQAFCIYVVCGITTVRLQQRSTHYISLRDQTSVESALSISHSMKYDKLYIDAVTLCNKLLGMC